MLNEYLRWEKNGGNNDFFLADDAVIKYKRSFTEFGLGYFTNLNRENNIKLQIFTEVPLVNLALMKHLCK